MRQGGEIGRRARLRIAKSSISGGAFHFKAKALYEGKTRVFRVKSSRSRTVGRNTLVPAQILAHGRRQIRHHLSPEFRGTFGLFAVPTM